jgi:hypothetical protein
MRSTIWRNLFMLHQSNRSISLSRAVIVLPLLAIAGCATPPPRHVHRTVEPPPPPPTQVYVYPNDGQDPARLDRDRYECHVWAVKETGFDPSGPSVMPSQRVHVVAGPPPGTGTVVGAATGAVLGAVVSRNAGAGAAVGAVAGAIVGTASDAAREERAQQIQERYDARDARRQAQANQLATDYRRAISACLEGRGYTVK